MTIDYALKNLSYLLEARAMHMQKKIRGEHRGSPPLGSKLLRLP
jgi:hypothetical protein